MEAITVKNLTFSYPERPAPALSEISFSIGQGEFVTLCGRSGSGKTTLLRLLKTALAPHGTLTGEVLVGEKPLSSWGRREQSEKIGFVMQFPEHQIVTDKVWHELAFGLESLGYRTPEIRARVAETASFFGIEGWFYKEVAELSGGQKQLLNLASVMAAGPSLLLLDEPTAQLDPVAASEFLDVLGRLNRELGVTVLICEQRLEEAIPMSNRVIVLDGGRKVADGGPRKVGEQLLREDPDLFRAMPTPMRIWAGIPSGMPCPVTVGEGRNWFGKYAASHPLDPASVPARGGKERAGRSAVKLTEVWFRYEKSGPDVLRGLSLDVRRGELFAILGGNGAGKTTALSLISGLNAPQRGRVELEGRPLASIPERERYGGLLGVLPQNPQALFVRNTVELDLLEALQDEPVPEVERKNRVDAIMEACGLHGLGRSHPYDLSGGEQQRAALAKVLLANPRILLLDEPTKGLDVERKEWLAKFLHHYCAGGGTAVMVSHDVEFCACCADRCALFFDGAVVSEEEPGIFFSGKNFYTTAANRMARSLLPGAVTPEDVIAACGGSVALPSGSQEKKQARRSPPPSGNGTIAPPAPSASAKRRLPASTVAALFALTLAIPLTIAFGLTFLEDRAYYFISLLVLLEAAGPFLLLFEKRRLRARELVVIAVLCALAVGGRAAFFMVPEVKPMTALVILAGAALGGETGFVVGATAAFASNLFFGQGPWTPWQMLAWGSSDFSAESFSGATRYGGASCR
jgi:energy-coupling factor transporter ATP-binding protein EcfA2